jgi:hypothetical protein
LFQKRWPLSFSEKRDWTPLMPAWRLQLPSNRQCSLAFSMARGLPLQACSLAVTHLSKCVLPAAVSLPLKTCYQT